MDNGFANRVFVDVVRDSRNIALVDLVVNSNVAMNTVVSALFDSAIFYLG